MTRKTLFESIRLFAGLSALALAASACAPAGTDLSKGADTQAMHQEVQGPKIDDAVEQEISINGEARVHVRALAMASGVGIERASASGSELPPEIIALLSRLPEGSLAVEAGVEGQPEVLGVLTREGLAALRYDSSVEFVAKDREDDLIY
ncbi:MAG: hypothetical protein V4760_03305 [Bdellovibrionota bacterium]